MIKCAALLPPPSPSCAVILELLPRQEWYLSLESVIVLYSCSCKFTLFAVLTTWHMLHIYW